MGGRSQSPARRLWAAVRDRDQEGSRNRHRDDLQGLRAVAVLLVALSHARVSFLGGGFVGVDVFFVLSGFLITGLLLNEAERRGNISLAGFYSRRAKRILPAAALTLVVTDIVAYQLLNFVRAKQVMWDSVSAAFFAANVHFAHQGTDYFAQLQPPSPLQHYWTLAVEEQFYVVWPALLWVVLFGARAIRLRRHSSRTRRGRRNRGPLHGQRLLVVATIAFIVSLAWSVRDTETHPTAAYFSTFTRAWELALGAIVAIAAVSLRTLSAATRAAAGWVGLAGIVTAAIIYSSGTAFPGYMALLPTIAAALVIISGLAGPTKGGAGTILGLAPMRYIGDRSYGFYLWHWPVLIIALEYHGHRLAVTTNLLLLAAAFALSAITYAVFENPIRRTEWTPGGTAFIAAASVGAAFAVAAFLILSIQTRMGASAAALPTQIRYVSSTPSVVLPVPVNDALSAVVKSVADGAQPIPLALLKPQPGAILDDRFSFPAGCDAHGNETSSSLCKFGVTTSTKVLAVFGDSHMQMLMPAILGMAQRDGWVVVPIVKSACSPTFWTSQKGTSDCHSWYRWAVAQVQTLHPAALLITGAYSGEGATTETAAGNGLSNLAMSVRRAAKNVVIVLDVPGENEEPVDCVLREGATRGSCSLDDSGDRAITDGAVADTIRSTPGVRVIDPTPWFCSQQVCPTVIGNTVAYTDSRHVSRTYATQLAAPFRTAFVKAIQGESG
jgi:peptidoglycan/LPS O-acetylase OafA/YrhL